MLKMREQMLITGESVVGETKVCNYTAVIEVNEPEKIVITQHTNDKDAYKENRVQCRADYAEFEDHAYERQKELLAALEQ